MCVMRFAKDPEFIENGLVDFTFHIVPRAADNSGVERSR